MACELAKEFGLKIFNGGDILKNLAGEKGYLIAGKDWWDGGRGKKIHGRKTD